LHRIHSGKCEFCTKTVIVESVSAYVILMCHKERSQELLEDGVNKGRNALELRVIILQKL